MSRPIAYNASGPLSGSIRGGNVNYTVDSGNRDYTTFASKKWVPSADGVAPIVFVTDTYTQGFELNPSLAVPLFYSCNGTGSAAIIYTANRIPGSPGNYSDANVALNDLISARGYFILESNDPFEGVDADGLVLDLDAAKMSSYPQVGTNWRDLSGQGNTGALTNGPTWNSNGWFTFDGVDDFVQISNVASLRPPNELTIEMVVRAVSITANWNLLYGQNPYSGGQLVFLETGGQLIRALHFINGVEYRCNTNESISTTVFKHIVFTFKTGDAIRSYFNGTPSTVEFIPAGTFTYNTSNPYYLSYFGGSIPNIQYNSVKSYTKALSQAEVKQNYFGAPIVTDGLVFAVDANNIVSYPKSGTSAYNLTGSNTLTLQNGLSYQLGNGGYFLSDGTDDALTTPDASNLDLNNFTLEGWVWWNEHKNFASLLVKGPGGSGNVFNYCFFFYASNIVCGFGDGGAFYAVSISTPTTNTWHHIVGTYDGATLKFYLDGVLANSAGIVTIPNQNSDDLSVIQAAYPINGRVANARVYNRALSASEILQNYQAEQYRFEEPLNIPTFGLQAYWDASNLQSYPGSGTTWTDTISGNTMTWSSPAPQWNVNQFTTTPLIGSLRPMITTGYINGRTGGGAYSVVAIFKPISLGANQILFSMGPANSNCGGENIHPIAINAAGRFGGGACGGLGTWSTGGGVVPTTTKYYCVVTTFSGGSGGTETVYVDGVFDKSATMTTSTPVSAANVYGFGWIRDDGAAYGMNANLGVIMYYNRELTSAEVTQIYNSYKDTYQF